MAAKPIRVDSITGVWTYLLSIDWEETWLWVLMTFHLWCTVFTLLSILYKKYYPQIGLFTVYCE
ncbi:hypothetical protein LSH36_174g07026 [Paralvinella palmiformis]|uniref:Uncharacterized protein n=1 Tax=Paralvinella palmiformis TaxID=53620 RepID=A0AAD9JRS6_9ANNE|nr:hypothetical protein LSH36_174g07026 [Paralvinella palmiformis]